MDSVEEAVAERMISTSRISLGKPLVDEARASIAAEKA